MFLALIICRTISSDAQAEKRKNKGESYMEKRSLYMEKIDAKLMQYNAQLAQMKGKVAEVQVDMKLEYLDQVEKLEKRR